jgi:hypothetical protein
VFPSGKMLLRLPRAFSRRVSQRRPLFFTPSRQPTTIVDSTSATSGHGQRHFGGGGSRSSYDAKLGGKSGKVTKVAKVSSSSSSQQQQGSDPSSSSSSSRSLSSSSESTTVAESEPKRVEAQQQLPRVSILLAPPKTVSLDAFFSQERPLLEVTLDEESRRSATEELPLVAVPSDQQQQSPLANVTATAAATRPTSSSHPRQSFLWDPEEDADDVGLISEPQGADPEWAEGVASHLASCQAFVPPPQPTPVAENSEQPAPVPSFYDAPTRSTVAFLNPFASSVTTVTSSSDHQPMLFAGQDQHSASLNAGHYLHNGIMHYRWSSAVEWSQIAPRLSSSSSSSSTTTPSLGESLANEIKEALKDSRRFRRRLGAQQVVRLRLVPSAAPDGPGVARGGPLAPRGNPKDSSGFFIGQIDIEGADQLPRSFKSSSFFSSAVERGEMEVDVDDVTEQVVAAVKEWQDSRRRDRLNARSDVEEWVDEDEESASASTALDRESVLGPRVLNQRGRVGMDSVRRKRKKKMSKHKLVFFSLPVLLRVADNSLSFLLYRYKKRRFVYLSSHPLFNFGRLTRTFYRREQRALRKRLGK